MKKLLLLIVILNISSKVSQAFQGQRVYWCEWCLEDHGKDEDEHYEVEEMEFKY